MSETSIDLVPITQLPSRYGIARSNVYNRIKDLGIETVKQGRKAFVTAADLELLDGLHAHLGRGGTTMGFVQLLKKKGNLALASVERRSYITETSRESEPIIAINPVALVSTIETVVNIKYG